MLIFVFDLVYRWTFWYVYSISHRDKKKIKQMRRNDYDLREVYSFETVSTQVHHQLVLIARLLLFDVD